MNDPRVNKMGTLAADVKRLQGLVGQEQDAVVALLNLRNILDVYLLPQLLLALREVPEGDWAMVSLELNVEAARKLLAAGESPLPETPLRKVLAPFLELAATIPVETQDELPLAGPPLNANRSQQVSVTVGDFRRLQQVAG